MKFNLIDEKWIPVKRKDGMPDKIKPWEVTDGFDDNPVVALNAPRPDFNGALIQFLIGLVQTTFAPANKVEWKQKLKAPPSTDQLNTAFMTVHDAFELDGDGPRFMQDFNKLETQTGTIDRLLIDTPGEKTCKDNTDHFIKRNAVRTLCPSCCAMALFTLHTNSPAGGRGYMTSLRGGGPLTTLILGDERFDSLWHSIWLNVLETGTFLGMCNVNKNKPADAFSWLAATKLKVTEQDIHPAQYFWAMPRRINLDFENLISDKCDVCNQESANVITSCREVPNGTKYQEPMKHPLSAFNTSTKKAVLTQQGGVSYRHWLGFVINDSEGNKEPARIVHEFIERQETDWQFRLWAFGYDFVPGQNKARCWYEAKMPFIQVESSIRGDYEQVVAGLIRGASEIAGNARSAIKKAWFRRPGDVKGNMSFVDSTFWHSTEATFYETLNSLKAVLEAGGDSLLTRNLWHRVLCDEALRIFDIHAWNGPIEDADPKRVVIARKDMQSYNNGKKIKQLLGLPVVRKTAAKGKKKATP